MGGSASTARADYFGPVAGIMPQKVSGASYFSRFFLRSPLKNMGEFFVRYFTRVKFVYFNRFATPLTPNTDRVAFFSRFFTSPTHVSADDASITDTGFFSRFSTRPTQYSPPDGGGIRVFKVSVFARFFVRKLVVPASSKNPLLYFTRFYTPKTRWTPAFSRFFSRQQKLAVVVPYDTDRTFTFSRRAWFGAFV